MKYLAQLKSEIQLPDDLQKLQKTPYDSFYSTEGERFPEKPGLENYPTTCQGCPALELLDVCGATVAGCVKTLSPLSPWAEEWRPIPDELTLCPDRPKQAQGPACAFCCETKYTEAPDGWRCDGCGILYQTIDGSKGPRLAIH